MRSQSPAGLGNKSLRHYMITGTNTLSHQTLTEEEEEEEAVRKVCYKWSRGRSKQISWGQISVLIRCIKLSKYYIITFAEEQK